MKVETTCIVTIIEIFTDQLSMTVNRCYESVATVKKEQNFENGSFEKEFGTEPISQIC